jgi:tripartite-type tricarboxylate transporter receptor subunit TctC
VQAIADFYRGKQLNVLIGFGPGGANDAWARALARHMGKHIPGNPSLVPQNMPGAGTLKLANHIYTVAAKDGSVFGLINRGIPLEPLLGADAAQFDPLQMNWIGSPDKDTTVCAARKDAPVQTMQDLFTKELVVGATGSGADTAIYPDFLAEFLGMKFKTIKGYPGSNEIVLAMERGEVQGICVAYESLARQRLARDGQINFLFQAALDKDPSIPGHVPLALDLAKSEAERKALELFLSRVALGRPFVAPPGVPVERVAALRSAFMATMTDPDFVEETRKLRLAVDPIPGEKLAHIIAEIYKTPKDVVARVAETLGRVSK